MIRLSTHKSFEKGIPVSTQNSCWLLGLSSSAPDGLAKVSSSSTGPVVAESEKSRRQSASHAMSSSRDHVDSYNVTTIV